MPYKIHNGFCRYDTAGFGSFLRRMVDFFDRDQRGHVEINMNEYSPKTSRTVGSQWTILFGRTVRSLARPRRNN